MFIKLYEEVLVEPFQFVMKIPYFHQADKKVTLECRLQLIDIKVTLSIITVRNMYSGRKIDVDYPNNLYSLVFYTFSLLKCVASC
jgi:hypothetical protein